MDSLNSSLKGWLFFPDQPGLSLVILVILLMAGFYMMRSSIHYVIIQLMRMIYSMFRIAARSLGQGAEKLKERNRDVLLQLGKEEVEGKIEREFFRVNTMVERDLGKYPALQRLMSDQVSQIDDDYKKSGQVSPPPPEWVEAVESVAKLKVNHKSNPLTANILSSIHDASEKHQKEIITEFRQSVAQRHSLLQGMRPYWRRLTNTMEETGKTVRRLIDRSQEIDKHMEKYEEILSGSKSSERSLKSSAAIYFSYSLLAVMVAIGGIIINFNLIALPMSEMVGATARIGAFKVSEFAALVIILVEIFLGIFMMEALRFTHMFPVIGALDDKMRTRMAWISFSFLLTLACVEAALAFMRDLIAADLSALRHSLTAGGAVQAVEVAGIKKWIPMLGQMILGFILPFALALVAIPLESLGHSARVVLGELLVVVLQGSAMALRSVGNGFRHAGQWLTHVYDVFIFLPLWIERMVKKQPGSNMMEKSTNGERMSQIGITETKLEVGERL
jgi:cytochrome b subunit of formate dehydrogenase